MDSPIIHSIFILGKSHGFPPPHLEVEGVIPDWLSGTLVRNSFVGLLLTVAIGQHEERSDRRADSFNGSKELLETDR
ncbi:carotenoid oxygenase family protein [Nitrosospira briensis]|uniref:carotenoid oxygenase family protein n=1 Tax=Nitrosospira briensis TaxID=35799 RepID=UPI0011607C89|nr:carotenoid oxygenase family protein [Nitrosospira briensis]